MAEIVDVSDWPPSEEPEWMGTRSKVWLLDPQATDLLWLFKAVRCKEQANGSVRCFGEDWAEWLAVKAADHLQIPAAEVRLASWKGHHGVISRSMLRDANGQRVADRLEHGNELLQAVNPAYDKDQQREAVGYTLEAVWGALDGIGVPKDCQPPVSAATDLFAGILMLDALIANTDRHHENWGALTFGADRWLAPTYDMGTCLGFQEPDEERVRLLDRGGGHSMDMWVKRGRSGHFESKPRLMQLAVEGLVRVADTVRMHWLERAEAFDLEWWRGTIDSVPPARMSHPARMFAFEIVRLNRERLLDANRTR